MLSEKEYGEQSNPEPLNPSRLQALAGFDMASISELSYPYHLITESEAESLPKTITEQDRFRAFSLEFQNQLIWLITQFNLKSLDEIVVIDPTQMVTNIKDDGLVFDLEEEKNEDEPEQATPLKKLLVEGKELSDFFSDLINKARKDEQEHLKMLPFILAMIETELKKYPTQPRVIMVPRILSRDTRFEKLFKAIAIKFNLDAIVFPIEDSLFGAPEIFDGLLDVRNPKKYPEYKNVSTINGFPHFVQRTLQRMLKYANNRGINIKEEIPLTTPIGQEVFISKPNAEDKNEYQITLKSPTLSGLDWNPNKITESSVRFRIESDGVIKILSCQRMPRQGLQGTMIGICLVIEEQLANYIQ